MAGGFLARRTTMAGRLEVRASVDAVFPLFSPEGEKHWVPGWNPEILYPGSSEWREGQVFRTREELGEAVWIVSRLNREAHAVEYHRVEPSRYVAHIAVRCREASSGLTEVLTSYSFVGLTERGNRDIASMTQEAYAEKMLRWSEWIDRHLGRVP